MENSFDLVSTYGLWGLVWGSFLSGTMLPISSEAMLVSAVASGVPNWEAVVFASLGNNSACLLTYGVGRWLHDRMQAKWSATEPGGAALAWMQKHVLWSLDGSWLTLIGTP